MMRLPSAVEPNNFQCPHADLLRAAAPSPSGAHSSAATSGNGADTPPRSQAFHHPIDALGERADVIGLDGRQPRHPELVAAEFAVRLGVDDAIGPQDLATALASTSSEKSMVPTTCERNSGLAA